MSLSTHDPASPAKSPRHALELLGRYWPRGSGRIAQLPVPETGVATSPVVPPQLELVPLPDWAHDLGDAGSLLVPSAAIVAGEGPSWMRTDWLGAAEWFATCAAERVWEAAHGPVHSYSFRLAGWDERMWRRAWANRIALFLRRWAARVAGTEERELFGELPDAEIVVTHDVDAIEKTITLRIKQSAFHAFNAGRKLARGDVRGAAAKAGGAARFFLRPGRLWNFETITRLEEKAGIRSHFNFYGGASGFARGPKSILIDPPYDIGDARLSGELARLRDGGWTIGLHQSFNAWRDANLMAGERVALEQAAQTPVATCRQHWLRFSFADTWRAQFDAGFRLDTTLGFNDRPAFRNGAALRMRPLGTDRFESLPMIAMDSHFYDYREMTAAERRAELTHWIGEVRAVRGAATVLWHQQVMSDDYGWADGFDDLLERVCDDRAA